MKIKIEFKSWLGKAALEIEASSTKEAVEKAVKDGANLRCANLDGANLDGKKLWKTRPVLQLGYCGRYGRNTIVFFFDDKTEPLIKCGCFSCTIEEFSEKIHKTHAGTFHEYEYMAMVEHIRAIRKYQLEEKEVKDGE